MTRSATNAFETQKIEKKINFSIFKPPCPIKPWSSCDKKDASKCHCYPVTAISFNCHTMIKKPSESPVGIGLRNKGKKTIFTSACKDSPPLPFHLHFA